MIRKDFILRWVQELAKVLARLIGKDFEESLEIMDQAVTELLKLDMDQINGLNPDSLLIFLLEEKKLEVPQLDFLAELLAKQGELLYEAGHFVESRHKFEKALIIFDYTEKEQQTYSFEREAKLTRYRELFNQIRLQ